MGDTIKQLIERLYTPSPGNIYLSGLVGGAKSYLYSHIARHKRNSPILIVAATKPRCGEIADECRIFFDPSDARRIALFPESSVLPYCCLSPDPGDWSWRINVLYRLINHEPLIVIASAAALMRKTAPTKFISSNSRTLKLKQSADTTELSAFLTSLGYEEFSLVEDEGCFARRGHIFDIWPPTSDSPIRLELDGDIIMSMRQFDAQSQRSSKTREALIIIPARDFPFDPSSRERAAGILRGLAQEKDLPAKDRRTIAESIKEGIAFSGIETFMPIFHDNTATFFDYLPKTAQVILDESVDIESIASTHFKEVEEAHRETQSPERIIDPDKIILSQDKLAAIFEGRDKICINPQLEHSDIINYDVTTNTELTTLIHSHNPDEDMLVPLARQIAGWQKLGHKVIFTCHTELQAERLKDLFKHHKIELVKHDASFDLILDAKSKAARIVLGRLHCGFKWADEKIALITDEEIFGLKIAKRAVTSKPSEPFTSFTELNEGDFVVHERHGIGRYLKLLNLNFDGKPNDYLLIEYLGGDKLYVPVYHINLIGRYIGQGDAAPMLDKLGGLRWSAVQKKADASIRILAKELLDIYAAREVYPGYTFPSAGTPYEEFSAAFPYDETPDQAQAIDDVMRDMGIERPMDRLICGDVGYGKTEVAMRAAFRACISGKQVAVLVPTTVLALQHYDTFTRRFKDSAVQIDMLSRFKSSKEIKDTIQRLKNGSVDVVIGTHRLVQDDVRFKNLGLLIIDEEHRFGVRHKERIKKLKSTIDVLTLTATPIPRTLNMSLSGIRDISVINTAPIDRHAIETQMTTFDDGIIRQAILKELARGGQIFFVHNRVETIKSMHDRLARLIPQARIVVGHGQLREHELEKVMIKFMTREADVLLCTTIIESGLDIPTANTIIIDRADMFGLAELYQLRGRVGRSSTQACAYLLIPHDREITLLAKKRLAVLKRFTELGSGFKIAMHDLEFRGTGNLLGSAQSGHIAALGYEMYTKLLDRAIRKLKGAKILEDIDPELHLKVAAFLPADYISDQGLRIDIYRKLAGREKSEEIETFGEELVDRFGHLPQEVLNLLKIMQIKIAAKSLRIKQIIFDGSFFVCQLDSASPLKTETIAQLAAKDPTNIRIIPPDRLAIFAKGARDETEILSNAKNSLSELEKIANKG